MASILSYTLPIFSKILPNPHTVTKDVAYGDKPRQTADLYLIDNGKLNPTIIFIHGGGWGAGDNDAYIGRAKKYGLAGFNVIALNYTLATIDPETHWDAQIKDLREALNWIKVHSSIWGVDPNKLFVGGDSAGGHLALLLALDPAIKAVLNMFGPCDLTQPKMAEVMAGLDVFGHKTYDEDPQLYMDASPIFKLTSQFPPTFVVHSPDDAIVPFTQAEVLVKRLTQLGVYNTLLTYSGGHDLSKVPSYVSHWLELKGLWFMLNFV